MLNRIKYSQTFPKATLENLNVIFTDMLKYLAHWAINFQSDFRLDILAPFALEMSRKAFFFDPFSDFTPRVKQGYHLYHYTWSNTFSREKKGNKNRVAEIIISRLLINLNVVEEY